MSLDSCHEILTEKFCNPPGPIFSHGRSKKPFRDVSGTIRSVSYTHLDVYKRQDKYWSEATQHAVRNNISNGRFDPYLGQSPTAYFLGKVSIARNLEPNIPEECLVTQLAYHYDGEITKSRLSGRIKTIQETVSYTHLINNNPIKRIPNFSIKNNKQQFSHH